MEITFYWSKVGSILTFLAAQRLQACVDNAVEGAWFMALSTNRVVQATRELRRLDRIKFGHCWIGSCFVESKMIQDRPIGSVDPNINQFGSDRSWNPAQGRVPSNITI